MANILGIKLPDRRISDFVWSNSGPGFINCPGGLVIETDATGADANLLFGRKMFDPNANLVLVLHAGKPIQVCSTELRAKRFVVSLLKSMAAAYLACRK